MLFLFLAAIMTTLPGLICHASLSRDGVANPLLVVGWSWCYLVIVLFLSSALGLEPGGFWLILLAGLLFLAVVALRRHGAWRIGRNLRSRGDVALGAGVVVIGFTIYQWWVGPYMEIPADVYSHLGKLKDAQASLAEGVELEGVSLKDILGSSTDVWYTIYGFGGLYSDWPAHENYPYAAYLNSLVFLVATYYFSLYALRNLKERRVFKICAALMSTFFFLTYFGVNVFAYVRYYALAPTITAYVVFLAAVVCALHTLRGRMSLLKGGMTLTVLTATAAMLHIQEAVFILVMIWTLSLVEILRKVTAPRNVAGVEARNLSRSLAVGAGGALLGALLWIAAYVFLERNDPGRPWILPLSAYFPFVRHLYILDPSFQGYHVLALWGYVVYALFLWNVRRLIGSTIVVAGMAIPLVTVFNPFFVDLFLRSQEPYTLYRMLYMVPLPVVGGYLFVKYCRAALVSLRSPRLLGVAWIPIALLATLLPFDMFYIHSKYSRIYSLTETPASNRPEYWDDMFMRLETLDESRVVTDPVTGYVINGITKHSVRTRKFKKVYIELDDQAYEDDREMFEQYDGYVLVINRRGGGYSLVGKLSGHWSENVLETDRYYSEGLVKFVESNPNMFVALWASDKIAVYRIRYHV